MVLDPHRHGPFDARPPAPGPAGPPDGHSVLVSVVRLVGEQDGSTVPELRARLDRACGLDPQGLVEADLAAVTFISCEPLRVLAQTKVRMADRFRLTSVSRPVRRVIDLTGLDDVLGPVPEEEPEVAAAEAAALALLADLEGEVRALREATQGRAAVEQAKGLLMGINGCDAQHAWSLLVRTAAGSGVRIRDLAQAVTAAAAGEPEPVALPVRAAMRALAGSPTRGRGPL
ncbi:ANTAR domain-containing protein [Modestobacter versicolor]|uniref:ANTAR domain-containing protein n=1 Tax=Modestobacter versicolor TaxID=429133 RepID=UPI0034DF3882